MKLIALLLPLALLAGCIQNPSNNTGSLPPAAAPTVVIVPAAAPVQAPVQVAPAPVAAAPVAAPVNSTTSILTLLPAVASVVPAIHTAATQPTAQNLINADKAVAQAVASNTVPGCGRSPSFARRTGNLVCRDSHWASPSTNWQSTC